MLAGLDFRHHASPATEPFPPPQLYGLGVTDGSPSDTFRLYVVDLHNALATPLGAGFALPIGGDHYGMDFNPTVDRVRAVNDNGENFRINPNNGALAGDDTDLSPAGERVSGLAYDRVDIPPVIPPPPGATTAYAISVTSSTLLTVGGINQSPSPNTGFLQNAKPLGVALAPGSSTGFDISTTGAAYATMVDAGGQPALYAIDLSSGAATLLGKLAAPLGALAVVPPGILPLFAVPDTAAPALTLAGVRKKMSFAAFLKGVVVKVTPSEAASLTGELLGAAKKAKARKLASFTKVLATKSLPLGAGERALTLKPKKKKVGRPAKAFRVEFRITATDAAGNVATTSRTIAVKPPKKKKRG